MFEVAQHRRLQMTRCAFVVRSLNDRPQQVGIAAYTVEIFGRRTKMHTLLKLNRVAVERNSPAVEIIRYGRYADVVMLRNNKDVARLQLLGYEIDAE